MYFSLLESKLKKYNNKPSLMRISFFLLIVMWINFFFYSLITITIYKLLCFNVDYFIFNVYKLNKNINVFYSLTGFLETCLSYNSVESYSYNSYSISNCLKPFNIFYILDVVEFKYLYLIDKEDLNMNNNIMFNNLIYLNFYIRSSNFLWVDVISLQKTLIINIGETVLFFFRMFNPTHFNLKLITIYIVHPNETSLYLNKIQCFCYNLMFLYPLELIDLPVLLYIDSLYIYFYDLKLYNTFFVYYITFFN